MTFPPDGAKINAYPLYDRWGETFNTKTEAVVVDQARSLATVAFLMAKTSLTNPRWHYANARITGVPDTVAVHETVRFTLEAEGMDTRQARITWEAADAEPVVRQSFDFKSVHAGKSWVEAEAVWPDGRRVSAVKEILVGVK